jgi:MoaA/NifB/PqqE/SkfB family radical SAM enzyme
MGIIVENTYNQLRGRSERLLKLWRYAGLMLTYKCSAECEICYYHCSPKSGGLMPIDVALSVWESVVKMAKSAAVVHITGGEPFLYFEHLAEIVSQAKSAGLRGFGYVETNGSWATDRKMVADRIKFLDSVGMKSLRISWDPFHAEYIEQKNVELLVDVATELLGKDRVLVKWDEFLQFSVKRSAYLAEKRKECLSAVKPKHTISFTGRAGGELAGFFADKSLSELLGGNCSRPLLGSKGVHIDPYGNVFNGRCSGMIVGNVNTKPLDEIWSGFDPSKDEFFETVFAKSSTGLLDKAMKLGYKPKPVYAGKCHLCTDLRSFFFDKGILRPIIGPADCYGKRSEDLIMEHVKVG